MKFTPLLSRSLACGLLLATPMLAWAQQARTMAKAPAEVVAVNFTDTKVNGAVLYPMRRMEVRLKALGNAKLLADPAAVVPNKDWVDKVKVTVTLAYESTSPQAKKMGNAGQSFAFYRSSATILTMKRDGQASVFFYLPGDVVERDGLKKDPYGYLVELEVDGTPVVIDKFGGAGRAVSKTIKSQQVMAGFKDMAGQGVMENAGILRPQYQVPFEREHSLTPTLLREDATNL